MSFPRPIQWYHCHADLIWPDGTFKPLELFSIKEKKACPFRLHLYALHINIHLLEVLKIFT
jgi:hypothetical protein